MGIGLGETAPACIYGPQIIIGHFLLLAPCRLIEGIIGLILPILMPQCQSQQIITLAVIWIGVPFHQTLQRLTEILFALGKPSPAHQQLSICIVDTDIPRIPLEPLQIIGIRKIGGMAILLDMLAGKIQLLAGMYFPRLLHRLCRLRHLGYPQRLRAVFHQTSSLSID